MAINLVKELTGRIEKSRSAELKKAVSQAMEYLETDPKMMQKAILKYGLAGESDDDADEQ